jgi:hypothetical protein
MSDASPAAYGLTKHLILPLSLPFGGERDTIDAREASRRKDCFIPARIPKPYPTLRQSRDTSVAAEGTFVHIFTRARGSWMKKPCFLPPSISEADHPAPDCDAMPQTTREFPTNLHGRVKDMGGDFRKGLHTRARSGMNKVLFPLAPAPKPSHLRRQNVSLRGESASIPPISTARTFSIPARQS